MKNIAALVCVMLMCAAVAMAQAPVTPANSMVNAASFRPAAAPGGGLASGGIASLFGSNLATGTQVATTTPLPTELLGTRVTFNGVAAPLFFVSAGQINMQVPWGLSGSVNVIVQTPRGSSSGLQVTVLAAAPGLFSMDATGRGPGAVLNFYSASSQPVNAPSATIEPNGVIQIFATGAGDVVARPANGAPATGAVNTVTPVTVNIGGRAAEVLYSGLAPNFVGVWQVNARVPQGTPDGCFLPVQITAGNVASNTITVAVHNSRGNCNTATTGSTSFFQGGSFGGGTITRATFSGGFPLPPQPDSFGASFIRVEGTATGTAGSAYPPAAGGCIVDVLAGNAPPAFDPTQFRIRALNAGTLTLTGPFSGSPRQFTFNAQTGSYSDQLGQNALAPGTWTLAGSGGTDIGPFNTTLNIAAPLFSVTSSGVTGTTFSRTQPLRPTWTCGDPNGTVGITVVSIDQARNLFGMITCMSPCSAGQYTIGADLLGQLPPSSEFSAAVSLIFIPASTARIQATGLDFGVFSYTILSTAAGITLQ